MPSAFVQQSLHFGLCHFYFFFRHFAELLLLGLRTRVDLQLMLDYLPTYSHEVGGGPGKNITIFVKERQELRLFF
jgi:hypothetical protein